MTDISVQGVVKAFEQDKNILDGLTFEILEGERVGILGQNGTGKTTAFKIIVGSLEPDEGRVVIGSGKRIGLISQIPVYPEGYTAEDVLRSAHERLDKLRARMEELEAKMAGSADEALLKEYDAAVSRFEAMGGYDTDTDINKVANGLEISEKMRSQPFDSLSGGEKTRVNLARLILEKTDILLLDEPTNHLDLRATEWLEEYLLRFKGTVLAISHDRYFLDKTAQRVIEIVNGKAEFYSGNYSFFVTEKQRRFDERMKQFESEQAKIKQLTEASERLRLWAHLGNDAMYKRAKSMEKRIERLNQTDRPKQERRMSVGFSEKEFSGDEVLVIKGLSKGFEGRTLFDGVELLVQGGEHIALIGDNGTGKSTFIKMIMGEEEPDAGYIKKGPSVKAAYLPQIIKFKNPRLSVLDTMIVYDNLEPQEARNRLAAFKFAGEDVLKPVSALSGGEQSRLRLCSLMKDNINFLILDEPTNHLDITSREWIEEALEAYDEALLFVSHDRYFINRFATRVWELKDGKITDFKGTFAQYRAYKENAEHFAEIKKHAEKKAEKPKKKQKPQDTAKLISKLERDIAAKEQEIKELDAQAEEYASDYEKLLEIGDKRAVAETELDALYESWEELSE